MQKIIFAAAAAAMFGLSLAIPAAAHEQRPAMQNDGRDDFDFITGKKWVIKNRKLVGLFKNSTTWDEFEGIEYGQKMPNGKGIVNQITFPAYRPGYQVIIVRLFDPVSKKWSFYEINDPKEKIGAPMVGAFKNGIGIFEGEAVVEGVPVKVRYRWTADKHNPKWQQEFSKDGGKSWELNWTMDMMPAKD